MIYNCKNNKLALTPEFGSRNYFDLAIALRFWCETSINI